MRTFPPIFCASWMAASSDPQQLYPSREHKPSSWKDSPGGSLPHVLSPSRTAGGSLALAAAGWADAQHSKREIISWCQAEEMAVLVNWKVKSREEKYSCLAKAVCLQSGTEAMELSYHILRDISSSGISALITGGHGSLHWDLSHSYLSNEARVFCCTVSHDPVAACTSRKNILDKVA